MSKRTLEILQILAVCLVLVFAFLLYFFRATPIIKDLDGSHIIRIQCNFDGKMTEIKDFNEKEVLKYLSTCMERRTFRVAGSYLKEDVKIDIVIDTDGTIKQILLGNINYSYEERGKPEYEILNAEEVETKLQVILKP